MTRLVLIVGKLVGKIVVVGGTLLGLFKRLNLTAIALAPIDWSSGVMFLYYYCSESSVIQVAV